MLLTDSHHCTMLDITSVKRSVASSSHKVMLYVINDQWPTWQLWQVTHNTTHGKSENIVSVSSVSKIHRLCYNQNSPLALKYQHCTAIISICYDDLQTQQTTSDW